MSIAAQAARNLGGFVPNKIFIGGVPITVSEEQFRSYFEPFGAISKVELHALRGFGYITYESVESVDACLEKYEEHYLSKKWVEVKRSIPRELIDAYEREQRRLHAELLAANGAGTGPAPAKAAPAKAEPAVAPPPPTPAPAPAGTPASRRGGPSNGRDPPMGAPGNLSRIAQLKEMGFSGPVAKRVLSECAWDVNAAIDQLLSSGVMPEEEEEGQRPGGADAAAEEAAPATEASRAQPPTDGPPAAAPQAEVAAAGTQAGQADAGHGAVSASSDGPDAANGSRPDAQPVAASDAVLPSTGGDAGSELAKIHAEGPPADGGEGKPSVRKRIERVEQAWVGNDGSQLSVVEGQFVDVWVGTGTDNGWIHAEAHTGDPPQAGWLPTCVLKKLPEGQRWLRASKAWQAMDESQCSIAEGDMVVVWVSSRTTEGWTYAETEQDGKMKPGWLPVFSLEWSED